MGFPSLFHFQIARKTRDNTQLHKIRGHGKKQLISAIVFLYFVKLFLMFTLSRFSSGEWFRNNLLVYAYSYAYSQKMGTFGSR